MIEYESLNKANEFFFNEYREKFNQLLQTGWFVLGENVKEFENEFAHYHQLNYFVGVASGLDALIFSLLMSGLPPSSEIIVPSNTYIATILAILQTGHRPVLVEPDIETYNIDPQKVESAITSKTKAMVIVHLYGRPCKMEPLLKIKEKYNLKLIEDCAQAHGARFKNKMVGSFGDFAAFSFYPTKNLGALGDGGGVGFQNSHNTEQLKKLRNYGSNEKYKFDIIGYNSRLDEIQAVFLRIKLKNLNAINSKKKLLAELYYRGLKKDFILPQKDNDIDHVYHIFNIRHTARDKVKEYLLKNGIKTEIHYPISPNKQKVLSHLKLNPSPISEEIHQTTLSLPISWYHSENDILKVIEILNRF